MPNLVQFSKFTSVNILIDWSIKICAMNYRLRCYGSLRILWLKWLLGKIYRCIVQCSLRCFFVMVSTNIILVHDCMSLAHQLPAWGWEHFHHFSQIFIHTFIFYRRELTMSSLYIKRFDLYDLLLYLQK